MSRKVMISCALTGSATLGPNSRYVPVTPVQIADEAVAAAQAGAAIVHVHVRNPADGTPSMDFALYRETFERIRERNGEVLVNLTTGPGARYRPAVEGVTAQEAQVTAPALRTAHVAALRPDLCSLDIATMNFGMKHAMVNIPDHIRPMARDIRAAGVKPELELFDLGHIDIALELLAEGTLPVPPFMQFCLGITGGAPATPETLLVMRSMVPDGGVWSAFGIGRHQMPVAGLATLFGGHVRVGLEDNLYLRRGVLATGNAPLVERAVAIIESLGCEVATPVEARTILSLGPR